MRWGQSGSAPRTLRPVKTARSEQNARILEEVVRARHWHGAADRQGACVEKALPACLVRGAWAPVGRARENRKLIQALSPETWSETITGNEKVLAGKWGSLFLGYLLG